MPQVLLVRHCESAGQHPEAPLTARGEAQARALADTLAAHPIDRLISSPYLRARGTIEPFARRSRLVVEIEERLAERRLSPEPIEDWREVVKRSFVDLDFRAPGGESGRETLSRGWAALQAALGAGHRLPLLVSHGQLMSLVLHTIDATFGFAGWEALSNPDVYRLQADASGALTAQRVWA